MWAFGAAMIKSEIVHPGELTEHPANSNIHDKANIEELAESRRLFDQFKNLVVWSPPKEMPVQVNGDTHTLKPSIRYVIAGNGPAGLQIYQYALRMELILSLSFE